MKEEMTDNTLISDSCFLAFVKDGSQLYDLPTLIQFLKPWAPYIATYIDEILLCLQQNSLLFQPQFSTEDLIVKLTKAKRKAISQAAYISKKLKFMNDFLIAKQV